MRNNLPDTCSRIPLRIGILMDHPSPHTTALLEAVAARSDCRLEVVYCGKSAPERNWGSTVGSFPHEFMGGVTGPAGVRFNPGIFRMIDRLRVDVWVVNTVYTSATTFMAVSWLHLHNKKWVFMNEPIRPRSGLPSRLKQFPIRFVLNRADGIIATGKRAVEMYRREFRDDCPYASVPYFIDLSDFFRLPAPAITFPGEDIQFLTSCQMIARKGVDCLQKACDRLPQSGWRLTLTGDGPLRSRLEKDFAKHIRSGRVRFVGAYPYQTRSEAFARRHVFVFPSRWDGWGMVVPEALAAGLPVISSDQVTSAHEFIRDGENGFLVPAENPDSLADKMLWFIRNREKYSGMSLAARDSVARYSAGAGAEVLVSFLRTSVVRGSHSEPFPVAEKITWSRLTSPENNFESAKLRARGIAKNAFIRMSVAVHSPLRAKGNVILGYHLVLKEDKNNFEDQVKFYKDHFRLSSVSEILNAVASGEQDGSRLAITFDDGFRVLTQECLEILSVHGIKAAFFVPTGFVCSGVAEPGAASEFSKRAFCYRYPLEPMRPDDLKRLSELGHEVGSHGLFHSSFQSMIPESARQELETSRSMIADWTGAAPKGFCYPYGAPTSSLGDTALWVRQAGYSYALTLVRGSIDRNTNHFALPRHHVEGNWPIHQLRHFLLAPGKSV